MKDIFLVLVLMFLGVCFFVAGPESYPFHQGQYSAFFFLKNWLALFFVLILILFGFRRSWDQIHLAGLLRKTDKELEVCRNRYYKIYENIRDIYCEILFDGTILEVSPAIINFTGYSREDFLGEKIYRFYAEPGKKDIMVRHLLDHGELKNFELDFLTRWGSIYTGSLNCILERDKRGEPLCIYGTMRDVTEWRRTIRLLEESEQKYREIFENIQDVYYEIDMEGKIIELSPAIEKISLYQREDLIGTCLFSCCENPEKTGADLFTDINELGFLHDFELSFKSRDGRVRNCSLSAGMVFDDKGKPLRVIGSIRDITDRKQAEQALRKSRDGLEERVAERTAELLHTNQKLLREIEDRKHIETELLRREETFRALTENSTDIIIRFAKDLSLVFANSAVKRMTGLPAHEVRGKTLYDAQFHQNLCHLMEQQLPLVFEEGISSSFIFSCPDNRGGQIYDWRVVPEWSGDGKVVSVLCTARDITLLKSAENRIKVLTQELIRAQENERQRIARDLHDHIAQDLATLKIMSQNLFDVWEDVPHVLRQRAEILNRTLGNSIQSVRDLAYDLRPPTLDALGLVRTLFVYCEDVSSKYGIPVDFSSAGMDALNLDFDTEINLYRLLQEALSNVRKHASATRVTVRLVASHPHIILRIEDDGKGFDPDVRMGEAVREKRMGLRSMEERVALLEGEMKIMSAPGMGTRIHIKVAMRLKENDHLLPLLTRFPHDIGSM
ncbi:PAS domain S-box-containing protein [Desulfobotulus alkaliphilus]|uniref:PAS domain S-box-containing protein n=1 Tax=Desulfobotulus alkaliphilus TaxID=622671 RepID=A0A562RNV3_9BACT|nr:PAS domain S-box protein [Desulfobotulus alkaliphilus]TWI70719.1 PAS domain S-box-containing protein [Desulfobotulus alkaliphilus]